MNTQTQPNVMPYPFVRKFVSWDVPFPPHEGELERVIIKAHSDEPLTKEEKNRIAGLDNGENRNGGYVWSIRQAKQIKRILVKVRHYGWQEYYAPNKTSLRNKLGAHTCLEMVYITK